MQTLEKFEFESKIYEIKLQETEDQLIVRAYLQGKPVELHPRSISKRVNHDFINAHGKSAIEELVSLTKNDLINKG